MLGFEQPCQVPSSPQFQDKLPVVTEDKDMNSVPSQKLEQQSPEIAQKIIYVRAPRRSWREFLLFLTTFSLYSMAWTFGRARDIRNATGNNFTPWLWVFAPLFGIFGAIAYQKLFDNLAKVEDEENTKRWKSKNALWLLFFVVLSIALGLDNVITIPFWVIFILLFALAFLFSTLHRRFNQWKLSDSSLSFYGKENGYAWYEWLVLLCTAPLFLFIIFEYLILPLRFINTPNYNHGQTVTNDAREFSLTIEGEGWYKVPSGTLNNETTKLEMYGPVDDSFIVIYAYDKDHSISSVTGSRYDELLNSYGNANCKERQVFTKNTKGVHSLMECYGRDWTGYYTIISAVVQQDSKIFELVGKITRKNKTKEDPVVDQIHSMASSFQPI
ncbi:hypothetical protein [Arenicella sp. 4NH20-0111]|uniref:hypothetical protein n=1 Tax=Arenicella sp. 4NH20-0111 TaxID=3127648 RepID=UPI003342C6DD